MPEEPTAAMPEKRKPTARVTITEDEAKELKVGSSMKLEVQGRVTSVQRCYDDKERYDVEIEDPSVKKLSVEMKSEDDDSNYATMPKEKLKAKISKSEE